MAAVAAATSPRTILSAPGIRRTYGTSLIARLPMGAHGLVLLLFVHQLTGSYALGGAASGAFAGGGNAPLTGQLTSAPTGTLRGADLVDQLTDVIRSDGGDVGDLRCPDTPSVAQGVVTVCHGTISGGAWAVAVFFEDGQGRFTALPM